MPKIILDKQSKALNKSQNIARQLDVALKDARISYTDLASELNMSRQAISQQFIKRHLSMDVFSGCLIILKEKGHPVTIE